MRSLDGVPLVYFIQAGDGGPIKIGWTENLYTRLSKIRSDNRDVVSLLGFIRGGLDDERSIHERFSHLSARGEWFEPGDDLLSFIDSSTEKTEQTRTRKRFPRPSKDGGFNLSEFIGHSGLKLCELAQKIGVRQTTIWRWFNGTGIDGETLLKLHDISGGKIDVVAVLREIYAARDEAKATR